MYQGTSFNDSEGKGRQRENEKTCCKERNGIVMQQALLKYIFKEARERERAREVEREVES